MAVIQGQTYYVSDTETQDYNYGLIIVLGGGQLSISVDNFGTIIVESDCGCFFPSSINSGNVIIKSVAVCEFQGSGSNLGAVLIEGGGYNVFQDSSSNNGGVIVESGGINAFDGGTNYGSVFVESYAENLVYGFEDGYNPSNITYYNYSTVTYPDTNITEERQTTHFTGDLSSKIITITEGYDLYNITGSYMTDCIASNILYGKTIAEVAGSLHMYYAY